MITDAQARFSRAQALTTAGTILATNCYDTGAAGRNIGRGEPLRVTTSVDTSFVGGTSIAVQYIQSANPDMSAPDVLFTGPVTPTAQLVAGAKLLDVHIPQNSKRYVGAQYVVVGTFTAGALSTFVVHDTDGNPYFAANTGL